MLISLHKQATTTPKIRAAIQASSEPAWRVAERYGISEQTVWKWRGRDDVHDRSHTPHRLQTTLTPAQEAVAVALRKALLLPLDDLLAVVREFLNPHVSRSGLDRCLRRHGAGNLQALKPCEPKPAHGTFKAYAPGYLHIDIKYLPQMADEDRRRYLFVAIDRATRWVFVRIYPAQTAANARRFLRDLERAAPMKITRVLTDNGKAFTDRLFGLRKRAATGQHEFDLLCADLGIEHRLAQPMRPQTNGMVERFNGRIEDILQSHRFHSGEDLEQTLLRYAHLYNNQLPQSVLKGRSPINALKDWQRQRPELFRKRVCNHAGCDSEPKSEDQQACAVLFRARERLLHQRTELVNALRSVLYEYGHVFPKGIAHLRRIEAVLAEPHCDLPALVREECLGLLEQISEQTARIETKTAKARFLSLENDTARRLQTMPGVGPQTALAISGFAPPMSSFKRGRDFAAWLGLVPRQHTSGGRERMGRISKAGQTDIRYLLITGAMSRLTARARKAIQEGSWLARLLHRKPPMLVAIALANKMARAIWAMMTKDEDYRDPARVVSA